MLLGTPGVLTRPWCLVEIVSAHARGIPVVLLQIARRELDLDDAARLIDDLETELDRRNPNAFAELMRRLPQVSLSAHLKEALRTALKLDERRGNTAASARSCSTRTDNALIADATDLVDAMASARPLRVGRREDEVDEEGKGVEVAARANAEASASGSEPATTPSSSATTATRPGRAAATAETHRSDRPAGVPRRHRRRRHRSYRHRGRRPPSSLLLQTKGILHRPFVEILEAVRLGIPIVPIAIEGCGYDFDAARAFCEASPTELAAKLEAANPGALAAVARGLTPQGAPQTARGGHASPECASRLLATALATIPRSSP